MSNYSFEVTRSDLSATRFVDIATADDVALEAGEAILCVDKFALTANNITYGVAGDLIGYWQFFPAEGDWGRIPVWGTGTVTHSNHPGMEVGQRFYGYYPMSSYLKVKADHVTPRGFTDGADHRAALPIVYNQYALMNEDNGFASEYDNQHMVYRPLFTTSFVLDDYLFDNEFFGAKTIILSSASSKTSFGLGFLLRQREDIKVIGLTSNGNRGFCENMGIYDQVVSYDDIASLDADEAVVFVDMAGNRSVLEQLHNHYQDNMKASCGVGITHYDSRDGADPATLPGAKPAMFFAPSQIEKRNKDWGPEQFQANLAAAWSDFLGQVDNWVSINEPQGRDGMLATYETVLGGARPDQAYVIST